jgi:hypothetical protein
MDALCYESAETDRTARRQQVCGAKGLEESTKARLIFGTWLGGSRLAAEPFCAEF